MDARLAAVEAGVAGQGALAAALKGLMEDSEALRGRLLAKEEQQQGLIEQMLGGINRLPPASGDAQE